MNTTLNLIIARHPCGQEPGSTTGWRKLLKGLNKTGPDDEPLPLARILEINGLEDAVWAILATPGSDRPARLFAVDCAREVQHLMTDPRSVAALDVAEKYANGLATDDELAAAWTAARDAAGAAARAAAWTAARDAAWTAVAAAWTAVAATWPSAWTAAWDAAWYALRASAGAAGAATWSAAWYARRAARAAGGDTRNQQAELFLKHFGDQS